MHITMVKKRLADGSPCRKCLQVEEMLRGRGVWGQIDEVIWAEEGDAKSAGMVLSARHNVETAPFFLVQAADAQAPRVYRSALKLLRECMSDVTSNDTAETENLADIAVTYEERSPQDILSWVLTRHGERCAIAFSGAEDVVLIDMAAKAGHSFSVFTLDTGRLHPETYEFLDRVRSHYGVAIDVAFPQTDLVSALVRKKGLFSFYDDGHSECCKIRKVAPLRRMLENYDAWITGQRRDQSPETRSAVQVIGADAQFATAEHALIKVNPLANWTSSDVWDYIHANEVPYNPLHARGFVSIGCAPCTRAVLPGQHERLGRWWWEQAEHKECGLHQVAGETGS